MPNDTLYGVMSSHMPSIKMAATREILTDFSCSSSSTVIQSNHSLSSRTFSTRGNRRVQPVLYFSEEVISAALIWTIWDFHGSIQRSGFSCVCVCVCVCMYVCMYVILMTKQGKSIKNKIELDSSKNKTDTTDA